MGSLASRASRASSAMVADSGGALRKSLAVLRQSMHSKAHRMTQSGVRKTVLAGEPEEENTEDEDEEQTMARTSRQTDLQKQQEDLLLWYFQEEAQEHQKNT